ncbi:hypothetical protein VP01_950g4 [Puccinia sorghi]|uniref:Uncharacterized protein n=1 Tax=Puccinia sorghi TaxID=27349 RepID=A0A0L6U6E8_9BASI|nr:hypothetical protein VP01_950g4 [Puccinia sorghi]
MLVCRAQARISRTPISGKPPFAITDLRILTRVSNGAGYQSCLRVYFKRSKRMHYSPQIVLLEAITCALMLLFYCWHSWHYDRLQPMFLWKRSVKTTRAELDPTNSFHLIMRFIYLICLPISIVQAAMIAYVKYQVGYLPVERGGELFIIFSVLCRVCSDRVALRLRVEIVIGFPVPYTSWAPNHIRLIYVSYYLKALGWLGEGIVHLEELAFWVFLINLKATSPPWFKSVFFRVRNIFFSYPSSADSCHRWFTVLLRYFLFTHVLANHLNDKTFVILSAVSSGALVAIVSASQPNVMLFKLLTALHAEICNVPIDAGSLDDCGDGLQHRDHTCFFLVAERFEKAWRGWFDFCFLGSRHLTTNSVLIPPAELVIRLHGFGTLNQIRIIARLIFTVPLFALSADGLRAQPLLNRYVWVIDLTVMTSIVAFAAQGIITLLIFLPRNLSKECGYGQDDVPKQDKSSNQPLLNRTSVSECVPRLSSDPVKLHSGSSTLPRPPSPSTPTLSPSEKHNSYSPTNPPLILSDARSFGNTDRNSNPTNLMNSQTLSGLTRCGRDIDRSSFVPKDLVEPFSPGTSRICMESSPVVGIFASPSTSRSPSWLPPAREFNPAIVVQGNSIPFPISSRLTHFPRYFAPSECRAFESFDGRSSKSIRTVSRSFSIKQARPTSHVEALEQAEQLDSIHPAIRYFKSPIDISSACFPEVSEKESLS